MKKKSLLIALLLMAVGFATVSTTLYLNGSTNIVGNKADFRVYYSSAKVNGVEDNSVVVDDTHLSFKTTLDSLGQTYVLDYDVTNSSKNYDAKLTMSCTSGNEWLTVNNSFDTTNDLLATDTRSGKLTLTLSKSYTGNDLDVEIECTINASAVERTSAATATPIDPETFCLSKGYSYGMLNVSTYGIGATEEGDMDDAYYLCSDTETYFENEVAGYDINGEEVYYWCEGVC